MLQPESADPRGPLGVIVRDLTSRMLVGAVVREAELEPREVTLPGYNLLSFDDTSRTLDWVLPPVSGDADDILNLYESFADSRLGRVTRPERPLCLLFNPRHHIRIPGPHRKPREWWLPCAVLIATAAKVSRAPLEFTPSSVALDLDGLRMEAHGDRVWSNFHKRFRTTTATAMDANADSFCVPPLTTSHPLAWALMQHDVAESTLWAANGLLRCDPGFRVQGLKVARTTLRDRVIRKPEDGQTQRAKEYGVCRDRAHAVDTLRDAAVYPEHCGIKELYDLAVPLVMPAKRFIALVGNPWVKPDRSLGAAAAQRLREHLLAF